MADIQHDFVVRAPAQRVYETVSTPRGLDAWWTKRSSGEAKEGVEYQLWFGPEYDWRAVVSRAEAPLEFELRITRAHADWMSTLVGFRLEEREGITQVRFHHSGWPSANDHFRTSSYCWAMYLRLLKRHVESGEFVAYERRLDA